MSTVKRGRPRKMDAKRGRPRKSTRKPLLTPATAKRAVMVSGWTGGKKLLEKVEKGENKRAENVKRNKQKEGDKGGSLWGYLESIPEKWGRYPLYVFDKRDPQNTMRVYPESRLSDACKLATRLEGGICYSPSFGLLVPLSSYDPITGTRLGPPRKRGEQKSAVSVSDGWVVDLSSKGDDCTVTDKLTPETRGNPWVVVDTVQVEYMEYAKSRGWKPLKVGTTPEGCRLLKYATTIEGECVWEIPERQPVYPPRYDTPFAWHLYNRLSRRSVQPMTEPKYIEPFRPVINTTTPIWFDQASYGRDGYRIRWCGTFKWMKEGDD